MLCAEWFAAFGIRKQIPRSGTLVKPCLTILAVRYALGRLGVSHSHSLIHSLLKTQEPAGQQERTTIRENTGRNLEMLTVTLLRHCRAEVRYFNDDFHLLYGTSNVGSELGIFLRGAVVHANMQLWCWTLLLSTWNPPLKRQ